VNGPLRLGENLNQRKDCPPRATDRRRKRLRLKNYDYSAPGTYFITVCTYKRDCLLGEIAAGRVRLSSSGRIVEQAWRWVGDRYSSVELDEWVVMPNHLHAILTIRDPHLADSTNRPAKSLGRLTAAFKGTSTNEINRTRGAHAPVWQRGFYDHIVRTEEDLARIRRYVIENPIAWVSDPENPAVVEQDNRNRR
jgi:putative transposase